MRWLIILVLLTTTAFGATRAEFSAKLAKVKPGMTRDQVKQLVGPPDDIRTERDPGGIVAKRTTEVWRYGTSKHLGFGTLGTVHLMADGKVQYVFGGNGLVFSALPEPELRRLLEAIDAVPSYNAVLEPLALIRAVNALLPLGKSRALEVVEEYLRVSSEFDDPGRGGVFLLMRVLFDPPAQVPMMVGAPTAQAPTDPKLLPRFPLMLVDDVPYLLVRGYSLGGEPQSPESDVSTFRRTGVLRSKPLAPSAKALDQLEAMIAGPLGTMIKVDDPMRAALYDQALRLFGTVYRPANRTVDSWFPEGIELANRWKQARLGVDQVKPRWDVKTQQFVQPNGKTLPAIPGRSPRVWWDLPIRATKARVTFERLSDQVVEVELRLERISGVAIAADVVRILDAKGTELVRLPFVPLGESAASTLTRMTLPRGTAIKLTLGAKPGPTLTP